MDANGFGDTPGEDRTSPDSYLSALEKWLVSFTQTFEQLQEERRKFAHLLHERDSLGNNLNGSRAQVEHLNKELVEYKAETVALKKGISKLQKKRENLKSKHEAELDEVIAGREAAVNDNIALSKENAEFRRKLEFCLKAVPTLHDMYITTQPINRDQVATSFAQTPGAQSNLSQ